MSELSITLKFLGLSNSRVDLHPPKMLIVQFHTSSVWENACHTIFIQFLKMVENWYKFFFWGCLILIKQSGDKKLRFSFFEKNAYHTIPIYGNCMTGIFLMATQKNFHLILKIWSKIFFCFFFSTANRFSYANKYFSKKKFCMQNWIFCVHNVVLDAIKLAFTFFSLNFFFQKCWKFFFLLYGVLMYALINVW